jgi:hypothetical protein
VSGDNHCRAHLSESEDLGSVAKSEVKFELPVFQGRRFRDKDERVKAVLRDVFLEGSEKYPKDSRRVSVGPATNTTTSTIAAAGPSTTM